METKTPIVYTPVQSSNIQGLNFTPSNDPDVGVLTIHFANDSEYEYLNVDAETANNFFRSESIGRFFHQNIRGVFSASKIEAEADEESNDGNS